MRIVVFSDLHFTSKSSFWDKVAKKTRALKPDLLLILGDFGNFGKVENPIDLSNFLSSLPKPALGSFAVFGNHDYSPFVLVDEKGSYRASLPDKSNPILKGLKRLFSPIYPKGFFDADLRNVQANGDLVKLLQEHSITLMQNSHAKIHHEGVILQLVGVGEYMCKKMEISKALEGVDPSLFTIFLMHNPDGVFHLEGFEPEIILSGHTHGAQINLPFLWKRFVLAEHLKYCRGKYLWKKAFFYITRGLGSAFSFRLFSPPELLCIDLEPTFNGGIFG